MAAAAHPITPHPPLGAAAPAHEPAAETALVPVAEKPDPGSQFSIKADSAVGRLPVELEVGVPVRGFRVRNLLALEAGTVVGSRWSSGEDLPLSAGDVHLAWTQFEVLDNNLAARVTRIA